MKKTLKKYIIGTTLGAVILAPIIYQSVFATVTRNGYCFNQQVGWVNMSGVDFNKTTRKFSGTANFYDGKYLSNVFSNGEIDFTEQPLTALSLSLASELNGSGNFNIIGQAFSQELGWIVANHGGASPAQVTPDGELTGNFWSNEFGWFSCTESDIGSGNSQIWDIKGVVVEAGDTLTSEAGDTGNFTVKLLGRPSADVTITLSSSNTSEGTVPASVTFTPLNWSTPQTVTVTGVNDVVPTSDGAVSYTIVTGDVTSSDTQYDALDGTTIDDITFQNQNDDAPGIMVETVDTEASEGGATAKIQFKLLAQPNFGADVTIPLSYSNSSELSGPASITIANANWNTPSANEVVITGVDDVVIDGDVTSMVVTGDPTSADGAYDALGVNDAADINIVNTDNDVAGVTFTPSGGTTTLTEGGATDTYTVVLNTQPTFDVTVNVSSNSQFTRSPTSLTFSTGSWNVPQTVTLTAVDDQILEGNHTASVAHTITSGDTNYSPLTLESLNVEITDNDTANVTTSTGTLSIQENGGSALFTTVLTSAPLSNVVLNVTSTTGATVSPSTLTFTSANWNTPQSVTVTGVDNAIDSPINPTSTITFSVNDALSNDGYDGVSDKFVTATLLDNDTYGVTVTPLDVLTSEDTGTGSFNIVLNSEPTNDVTIDLSSSNTDEGTVQASVTFTPLNWNTPQKVIVTGVDDVVPTSDGAVSYDIITGNVTSLDAQYDSLDGSTISDITFQNQNNDAPGIVVDNIDVITGENLSTARVQFRLLAQPAGGADVTIPLSLSDGTEGDLGGITSITILNANWNTPSANEVVITGVNDSVADGNIVYTLVTGDPTSTDTAHDNLTANDVADVQITNEDNDFPGIEVTQSGGNTQVTEGGSSDSYTLVLQTEPTSNVTITLTGGTNLSLSTGSLIFTALNWDTPQNITVNAVDDSNIEGTHTAQIIHSISTVDTSYNPLTIPNVSVTITDNDFDTDGDTVLDAVDVCANTTSGLAVGGNGCPTIAAIVGASNNPPDGGFSLQDLIGMGVTGTISYKHSMYEKAIALASPAPTNLGELQDIIDDVNSDYDQDGTDDIYDADMDGDGTPNIYDTDTDGDGTANASDTDDDGDGTVDGSDTTPTGLGTLLDIDGDGIININDTDVDGDGVANASDTDDDGDGTLDGSDSSPTGLGTTVDVDGDGIANVFDTDVDGDGEVNATDTDDDADGTNDMGDTTPRGIGTENDIDGDGILNIFDTDVDGDGIVNASDTDDDGDGTLDGSDASPTGLGTLDDFDGDSIRNSLDLDMDGDGVTNDVDSDTDGDGNVNTTDTDDDGDNVSDVNDNNTTGADTDDLDGDGNVDATETAGFNGGDGNGDGIQDNLQDNVAGTPNPKTGAYTTIEATGTCRIVSDFEVFDESSNSVQDTGFEYNLGLNRFILNCTTAGASGQIKIFYDKIYDTSGWEWRKYNSVSHTYAEVGDIVTVSIASQTVGGTPVTMVTFTLTDGDTRIDEDGLANGVIVDPVGPAVQVASANSKGGGGGGAGADYSRKNTVDKESLVVNDLQNTEKTETPKQPTPLEEITSQTIKMEKEVNGVSKKYTLGNDYAQCSTIDSIIYGAPESYTSSLKGLGNSKYVPEILSFEKNGIIQGDEEGMFQGSQGITRAEYLKILLKTHCFEYTNENTSDNEFVDIEYSSWQTKVIMKALHLGVINGDVNLRGDKVFRPNDMITRDEALKMLVNMAKVQVNGEAQTYYTDVAKNWYEKYVISGETLGIISSENDGYLFQAKNIVSREEMVHMTFNTLNLYRGKKIELGILERILNMF